MATLYDYLASLAVNGNSLVWSYKPLTDSQLEAAAGNPYVYVEELDESPRVPMYGNIDVVGNIVDIYVFQGPNSDGTTPSRNDAMGLYYDLYVAHENMDEWIYGQRLIAAHRDLALPPRYDDDTGGLRGMVRLRLLFARS